MSTSWSRFGEPLYLRLLHANFLKESESERVAFSRLLRHAATGVPTTELRSWIQGGAWREMLVAGWLVGLRRETELRFLVTEKLLASATCFAGQGLCVATARFADERAALDLESYLEKFLPVGDRRYDQEWAIGALAWLAPERAERFLTDDLWRLEDSGRTAGAMKPHDGIRLFRRAMEPMEAVRAS